MDVVTIIWMKQSSQEQNRDEYGCLQPAKQEEPRAVRYLGVRMIVYYLLFLKNPGADGCQPTLSSSTKIALLIWRHKQSRV
jgi:hypothetical protein